MSTNDHLQPVNIPSRSTTPEHLLATPPTPPTSPKPSRNLGLILLIVAVFTLASGIWLLLEWRQYQQRSSQETSPHPQTQQLSNESPDKTIQDNSSTTLLTANFTSRQVIADQSDVDQISLSSIGVITDAAYQGYELWLMKLVTYRGPCKGAGCTKPMYIRFIHSTDNLIYLPKASSTDSWLDQLLKNQTSHPDFDAENIKLDQSLLEFLAQYGDLSVNENLEVFDLTYPPSLTFQNQVITSTLVSEEIGTPSSDLLTLLFEDETSGPVYSTSPEKSPQQFFYFDEAPYQTSGSFGEGTTTCQNEECYLSNGLFTFRPDGTYLRYAYQPGIDVQAIDWQNDFTPDSDYVWYTKSGCSEDAADYVSVVAPSQFNPKDLELAGQINQNAPIYTLNNNHAYIKHFYDLYTAGLKEWSYDDEAAPKSYEEFSSKLPLFFWKDPFNRLIRFTNTAYTPPLACEPIIYLYPEKPQQVHLTIGDQIHLLQAQPEYSSGWSVWAEPTGTITVNNHKYPYLFWEGVGSVLPRPQAGYIVSKENMHQFLTSISPQLGLNSRETDDFVSAWLPELSKAPYYRIGFYDPNLIDTYAPLYINPTPDTIIRILMDYQPLNKPIPLSKPTLSPPPERSGFSVVEWGGLKR